MATNRRWAFRVMLSYEGKTVKLESAVKLEMLAPPSIHIEGAEHETGSWFHLEDKHGRALYRRPMGNPFSGMREMLGGEGREFSRVKVPSTKGIIELLLPETPDAAFLVLSASETEGSNAHRPAQPVAKVSLKQVSALAERSGGDHGRK